jgi:hypothetical protein
MTIVMMAARRVRQMAVPRGLMLDFDALRRASLGELEALYAEHRSVDVPRGCFRGTVLRRLDNRGARNPLLFGLEWIGFEAIAFGIDFDERVWLFTDKRIPMGRFEPRPGSSRWRETETVQLHYDPSRLPGIIKAGLYDEVKPLSGDLCLGLGGVRARKGLGDHFFFALRRVDVHSAA